MEPPAKRLRILRSVEVDETNPDYIAAKQRQQEKFKGRLEKLFAKYGDMHESMSDEIDLNTGKLVVDRGHLRRVQRHMQRKGPGLLDSLLEPALAQEHTPEEEDAQAESEDELAPTQTRKRKDHSIEDGEEAAQSLGSKKRALASPPLQAASMAVAHANTLRMPSTPGPAANLFHQIQQTPLDQQAQAALFANLNQTIAHAVQQAVAPLLSILQHTPNGAAPMAPSPVPVTHLPAADNLRPAADPKWYFPPILAAKETPKVEQHKSSSPTSKAPPQITLQKKISSPILTRRASPIVRVQRKARTKEKKQSLNIPERSVERRHSSHSLPALCLSADAKLEPTPLYDTTSHKARKVKPARKYLFTEEDDIYISQRRELDNMSFKAIKASKAKWSTWPTTAIYNHWNSCLKGKSLNLRNTPEGKLIAQASATPVEPEDQFFSSIEIPETSSAEHRLPTPRSLEQEDGRMEKVAMPSSSHFDDDELELLSLAGADISDVLAPQNFQHADDTYPTPDEPLPSIEGAEFRNEHELQDELQREMLKLEDSPTPQPVQPKVLPSTIPETQESIIDSTPSQKRASHAKSRPKPIPTHRSSTDVSDDLNLIGTADEPTTPHVHIKRESLSPQATRILCSSPAPKTPWIAPQSSGLVAKSTSKLDRRTYLKEVKQGWAKTKGKTGSFQKRRSLNVLPTVVKRTWVDVDVGDSEDELAA